MIDIIIVSLILLVVYLNRCGRTTFRTQKGGMKTEYIVLSSLGLVALIAVAMYYELTKSAKAAPPPAPPPPPPRRPAKDQHLSHDDLQLSAEEQNLIHYFQKSPTLAQTFVKAPIAALANIHNK